MASAAPNRPRTPGDRVKNFLGWAFVISFAVHLLGGPLIPWKQTHSEEQQVEKVSVTKKIKVKPPTPPPPTPTPPPPTPPPKSTPPPVHSTQPPPQPKLKVEPPKTKSNNAGTTSSESKYNVTKGSQNGVPTGVKNAPPAAPAAAAAKVPVSTPPPPTPTPKPACAVPNSEAVATNKYQPETPEIAKQAGATGTAEVEVSLSAGGSVTGTSILKTTGNSALDTEALKAARMSSYSPKKENCVPVAGDYKFVVEFQ
ncbi:MAG: energy transducer TonB [Candidatus Eremiobacteraeota bacterium]|nr:energy transducer TonB [Candidatus Eremiobacteraeota bacterium]